ncbi:MAG: MFS transporter [Promethearchaeota archaeon]
MAQFKMSKTETFSFIVVVIVQFISMATANMLIPQYGTIIQYFGIDKSLIGLPDSVFILVSAVVSVIWGYFTDRVDRNRVIMMAAFLWSIGTTITALDSSRTLNGFKLLVIARGITGAGMGSVIPIALSIVGDLIPAEQRSSWFGTMAILSSISSGAGQGMASFLAPLTDLGWRFPFVVISVISLFIIILMFFIKIPSRGAHEEELSTLQELEIDYMYQLTKKDIIRILKKKTNLVIFIQGFLSIIPGTLVVYFLTTLFSDKDIGLFRLLPEDIRIQVSTIMAAFVGIGYLVGNSVLANLGDYLFKKNKKNRVLLSSISLFISVPLCILFVLLAPSLDQSFVNSLPENASMITIIVEIFKHYPQSIGYLVVSFIASFFSAAPVANRGAVMVDVNLPEHRGTTNSFFNLAEQLGKGFTLALSYIMLSALGTYQLMIIFSCLFWLPSAALWLYATKTVVKDLNEKSMILRERTQLTFLDYIFELEILMDQGVQYIHDFAKELDNNFEVAQKKLDKAIKIFKSIESRSKRRVEMTDLYSSAHLKVLKALMIKSEIKEIIKMKKVKEDISDDILQLKLKIEEQWEPSDIGKVETLYESAILKVISAEINRKYDLFVTIKHLKESINTYERVILLAKERLVDEDARKLNDEEKEFQERVKKLINDATISKKNTEYLLSRLENIVNLFKNLGVSEENLKKIIELANEYKVPYSDILIDSLNKRRERRKMERIINDIDLLFKTYDSYMHPIST